MTTNQVLYCTLYNTKIGNLSGFKINVVEAHRYLFDLNRSQTAISIAIAHRLKATQQELTNQRMKIEIALNPDSVSFETKIARGESPTMPEWASVEVAIKPELEMRIFDLIIGSDARFKFKASNEEWKKRIDNYRENNNFVNKREVESNMKLSNRTNAIWNKASQCNCDVQDCSQNHKLCGICGETIIYGAHESSQPNSNFAWNEDHIVPLSRGGSDSLDNLQAVHVSCNRYKGNS